MVTGPARVAAALACVVVASASCKRAANEEPPPTVASAPAGPLGASEIWALAPEGAVWGLVARDGALAELQSTALAISAVAAEQTDARRLWATKVAPAVALAPFPVLDPAGMRRAGIDLGRGGALFFGADNAIVLSVLPVGDLERLVTHLSLTQETAGGRTMYVTLDGGRCALKDQRLLCAESLAAIDAAIDSVVHPLASSATLVPRQARGDVEALFDLTRFEAAREASEAVAPFWRSATTLSASLSLEPGAGRLRAWMDGAPGPLLGDAPGALPAALRDLHVGATSLTRTRLPLPAILAAADVPAQLPVAGGLDLRADLLDHLTGDAAIVSRGDQLGAIIAQVRDPEAVADRLPALCEAIATSENVRTTPRAGGGCNLTISLAAANPLLAGFGPVQGQLRVDGDVLILETGSGDLPTVPLGPHAAALLADDRRVVAWGRTLDPLSGAPASIGTAVLAFAPADAKPGLRAARWAAGHVHVVAASVHTEARGAYADALVVTALADPPAVTRVYQKAVRASIAGDAAAQRRLLAELAADHPDTYAGRQAALLASDNLIVGMASGLLLGVALPAIAESLANDDDDDDDGNDGNDGNDGSDGSDGSDSDDGAN